MNTFSVVWGHHVCKLFSVTEFIFALVFLCIIVFIRIVKWACLQLLPTLISKNKHKGSNPMNCLTTFMVLKKSDDRHKILSWTRWKNSTKTKKQLSIEYPQQFLMEVAAVCFLSKARVDVVIFSSFLCDFLYFSC